MTVKWFHSRNSCLRGIRLVYSVFCSLTCGHCAIKILSWRHRHFLWDGWFILLIAAVSWHETENWVKCLLREWMTNVNACCNDDCIEVVGTKRESYYWLLFVCIRSFRKGVYLWFRWQQQALPGRKLHRLFYSISIAL